MKFRVKNYPNPLHHVIVKQNVVLNSGASTAFMVMYIKLESFEPPIVFKPLFQYFSDNVGNSLAWQRHASRAVGLFYDYCVVKKPAYKNENSVADSIRGFITASLNGDRDLGWTPSSAKTVQRHVSSIIEFSTHARTDSFLQKDLKATPSAKHFIAASKVKGRVMLSHVTDVKKLAKKMAVKESGNIYNFRSASSERSRIHSFPVDLIEPLFNKGFIKRNGKEDLGTKMITALLLFGGMRHSEPFHLWFNDFSLVQSTGRILVKLHHPEDSMCDIKPHDKMLRKEYLMQRGLLPRNDKRNPAWYLSGWKDLALDNHFQTEIRLIHPEIERKFICWFSKYMRHREQVMKAYRIKHKHEHPFLFVKLSDTERMGEPLSMKAYEKALKAAVNRLKKLGYEAEYGWLNSISPHPMRYWFATTLEEVGMPNKLIQKLMNHRSILSQEIYKGVTKERLDTVLSRVAGLHNFEID